MTATCIAVFAVLVFLSVSGPAGRAR